MCLLMFLESNDSMHMPFDLNYLLLVISNLIALHLVRNAISIECVYLALE